MSAYIVLEVEVADPEAYKRYTAQTPAVVAAFGGRFIVRGGRTESLEGAGPAGRVVVLEFPDMQAARSFYDSPDYQEIMKIRHAVATGRMFMVEGA